MLSPVRYAGIIIVILAVCGPVGAQPIAPPGSGVKIDKVVISDGPTQTVKYYVTGGSPRLQALVRRVEYAENELSVIEQLQRLKLDTVVSERRVVAARTAQLTSPYVPPGFIPYPIAPGYGYGGYCGDYGEGTLQKALKSQLAYEATPQSAMEMIGFLEKMQTELDAELKALLPQEKKEAQGPVDALRPRLAALDRNDAPAPPPQPVAPPQVKSPAPAVPQQRSMSPDPLQQMVRQNQENMRRQIMQTGLLSMQTQQAINRQYQLVSKALQQ